MADDYIPKSIQEFRYECTEDEDDQQYAFPKRIRHAKKMIIKNLCGTPEHL